MPAAHVKILSQPPVSAMVARLGLVTGEGEAFLMKATI
jgi:hypothetical protein